MKAIRIEHADADELRMVISLAIAFIEAAAANGARGVTVTDVEGCDVTISAETIAAKLADVIHILGGPKR